MGISTSRLCDRRAYRGRIDGEYRMRAPSVASRSRTRGWRTATGPMPVMISRSGRWPWRTTRCWPVSVLRSVCFARNSATSASTAWVSNARAPLCRISVRESVKAPGWASLITLLSDTAYHSFIGEVEALNTTMIRRLTPVMPSPTSGHSSRPRPSALYKSRWQVELFFKWIKQHLRIKRFFGTSENAVKTQIWIAVSVYVLVAIVKKQLALDASLYTLLQILSVTLFEKMPMHRSSTERIRRDNSISNAASAGLNGTSSITHPSASMLRAVLVRGAQGRDGAVGRRS